MTSPILIIDGSYLARRSFHSNSGMYRGFVSKLYELRARFAPAGTIVAWDGPDSRRRRREISAYYKAHRPPTPDAYIEELRGLVKAMPVLGVEQARGEGYEADDVMATLAALWRGRGREVLIYTADKDLFQLVQDGVSVVRARPGAEQVDVVITPYNCEAETGLAPHQWRPFLALAGDASDNVPGLPDVGTIWAKRLLAAAPNAVGQLLHGRDADVLAAVESHYDDEPKVARRLVKLVTLSAEARTRLRDSAELVQLQRVPDPALEVTAPAQSDDDALWVWLERHGLDDIPGEFADLSALSSAGDAQPTVEHNERPADEGGEEESTVHDEQQGQALDRPHISEVTFPVHCRRTVDVDIIRKPRLWLVNNEPFTDELAARQAALSKLEEVFPGIGQLPAAAEEPAAAKKKARKPRLSYDSALELIPAEGLTRDQIAELPGSGPAFAIKFTIAMTMKKKLVKVGEVYKPADGELQATGTEG